MTDTDRIVAELQAIRRTLDSGRAVRPLTIGSGVVYGAIGLAALAAICVAVVWTVQAMP